MSDGRMISAKMFQDEFYGKLSLLERQVWIGLITVCVDDQGRCPDNAKTINADIFPFDDIENKEINRVIQMFADANKIIRYEASGQKILQVVNWWKNQRPNWAARSVYSPPPNWTDRIRCHEKGNVLISLNWDKPGGLYSTLYTPLHRREDEVKDEVKEEDEDAKTTATAKTELGKIYTAYEQNIGALTQMISQDIEDDFKEYSADWLMAAIDEALKNNVRNWKYIQAILKNWKVHGFKAPKPGGNGKTPAEKPKPISTPIIVPKDWHQ